MIATVLRRIRTPRRMYSALDLASTTIIFVDTSLASLIMDGELWSRSPADLRLYRGDISIFDPEPAKNSLNLKRSIVAHSWAQSFGDSPNLRITPRVWQELASARQVSSTCILRLILLYFYHSNFSSVQFDDSVWAPFEMFFKKERGRRVKDTEVTRIIDATIGKLEAAVDDNEQISFEIQGSLQMFLATRHGRPLLFNDIAIFAEACIPESSFLATNDCKFAKVVTRPIMNQLFTSVVRDVLEVSAVPKIVLAERIIEGM